MLFCIYYVFWLLSSLSKLIPIYNNYLKTVTMSFLLDGTSKQNNNNNYKLSSHALSQNWIFNKDTYSISGKSFPLVTSYINVPIFMLVPILEVNRNLQIHFRRVVLETQWTQSCNAFFDLVKRQIKDRIQILSKSIKFACLSHSNWLGTYIKTRKVLNHNIT